MSSSYKVYQPLEIPQFVVAAIRVLGQRDVHRRNKDWAKADECRDLAFLILDFLHCQYELKDENGGTILSVRLPHWETYFCDTSAFEKESPGWLPHDGDRRCDAVRCRRCGRVMNACILQANPPYECPWCHEVGSYVLLVFPDEPETIMGRLMKDGWHPLDRAIMVPEGGMSDGHDTSGSDRDGLVGIGGLSRPAGGRAVRHRRQGRDSVYHRWHTRRRRQPVP